MKLKPLGAYLLIRPDEDLDATESGILITKAVKEEPMFGTIVSVGPRTTIDLKAEDRVVFKKYSPDKVELNKETFMLAHEDDIIAILEHEG